MKRIVALLEKRGTPEDPSQMIFILRKRPFTDAETQEIMGWSLAKPVIVPGRHVEEPYDSLLSGRKTMDQVILESPKRVGPVFDDSPFYFATERPWGMPRQMRIALLALIVPMVALLAFLSCAGNPPVNRHALTPRRLSILAVLDRFHCRRIDLVAAPHTAARTPDLHIVHSAIHDSGVRRSGKRAKWTHSRFACLSCRWAWATAAAFFCRRSCQAACVGAAGPRGIAIAMIVPFGLVMGIRSRTDCAGPERVIAAAAFLLGSERCDVGDWLGGDSRCGADIWFSGRDACRKRVLTSSQRSPPAAWNIDLLLRQAGDFLHECAVNQNNLPV